MECHILCVIVYIIKIDRPRWLIPFGCGSKLRGAGHESRPGRMLVIGVLNIQCFKLFKGMECAVMSMVLCTIKKNLEVIRFYRDIAMIVQKAKSVKQYSFTHII